MSNQLVKDNKAAEPSSQCKTLEKRWERARKTHEEEETKMKSNLIEITDVAPATTRINEAMQQLWWKTRQNKHTKLCFEVKKWILKSQHVEPPWGLKASVTVFSRATGISKHSKWTKSGMIEMLTRLLATEQCGWLLGSQPFPKGSCCMYHKSRDTQGPSVPKPLSSSTATTEGKKQLNGRSSPL